MLEYLEECFYAKMSRKKLISELGWTNNISI